MLISGSYDTTVRIWTIQDRVAEGPKPGKKKKT
jgi:hypothetical protein